MGAGPVRQQTTRWAWIDHRLPLAGLLAVHVALVWFLPYLPTRDGPTHLEGALALVRFHQPGGAVFREWFVPSLAFGTNWLDHLLMAALVLVVPAVAAEKIVVSLIVVGLPLAARRAFSAVEPGAGWLALLVFPFTFSWLFHMGFYNFCLGLALFFLMIASGLRQSGSAAARSLRLCAWAVALYVAHPMPLLAAAGLILLLAARDRGLQSAAKLALAFAPVAVLLGLYLRSQRSPAFERFPLRHLLADLTRLDVLVTFVRAESLLAAALAAVLAVLSTRGLYLRIRGRLPATGDAWLAATAAFLAVYLAAPTALFGGQYLTPRLMLFPCFGLMLWLATVPWTLRWRLLAGTAATVISLGLLAARMRSYRELNEDLREYLGAAPWIDAGSTVLPLHFAGPSGEGYPRVNAIAHAAAYVAAERGAIDLTFYEGTKRGRFPLEFKMDLDPYRTMGDNPESIPPCVDLAAYAARTGKTVDYVLTWREEDRGDTRGCAEATLVQIRDGYSLVHTSVPRGLLKVWRRQARGTLPH